MSNKEAMDIVLKLAESVHAPDMDIEEADAGDAIYQMQDYMNDVMRDHSPSMMDAMDVPREIEE